MTKEERELQQNIARTGINLGVLLDIGLFPGKHALALEECKGLVKSIVDNANAALATITPVAAHPPVIPGAGTPPVITPAAPPAA